MVRDGIYYGVAFVAVAILVGWLTVPPLAIIPLLLAAFFLWFFRDPERAVPTAEGAIVSPADGKITDISVSENNGTPRTRISIFLNVFDVHVNRSPVAGVITSAEYRKGKFKNAMAKSSAEDNEQNVVTLKGETGNVVFKQIAGLLARRIVFTKKTGDHVARGERVGMIKFGSRTDVIFTGEAEMKVQVGDKVKGGATVLAVAHPCRIAPSLQDAVEAR